MYLEANLFVNDAFIKFLKSSVSKFTVLNNIYPQFII